MVSRVSRSSGSTSVFTSTCVQSCGRGEEKRYVEDVDHVRLQRLPDLLAEVRRHRVVELEHVLHHDL